MSPDDDPTEVRFAPIPLVSGDTLTGEDGEGHRVSQVTVTITCVDGHETTVPLVPRHGGWWPPDA